MLKINPYKILLPFFANEDKQDIFPYGHSKIQMKIYSPNRKQYIVACQACPALVKASIVISI